MSRISASISRSRAAGAHHGGDRVVQLVGQAGGHRAEGDEPLVALDRVAGAPCPGWRGPRAGGPPSGYHSLNAWPSSAAGSSSSRQSLHRPGRRRVHLRHAWCGDVEAERPGVRAAGVAAMHLELAALHPPRHRQHPRQQHEEARRRSALGVDRGAGRVLDDATVRSQPAELLVVQLLEEEQRAQLVGGQPLEHPGRARTARRSACARFARSLMLQVAVDQLDRHRALADRRRDPLHRVGPHVAGGEHARARWPRGSTGRGRGSTRGAGAPPSSGRDR